MPELPEVEIVKRSLLNKVKNQKINKVNVFNRKLRYRIEQEFEKFLKNKKVLNISRKSKYIVFHFINQKYCILHLGMSGTLHYIKKNKFKKITNLSFYSSKFLPKNHNHVEIYFNKFKLIYNDPRRFGYFKLIKSKNELNAFFKPFFPEALDNKFNIFYLKENLKCKKKNIKNFLLDQNFVSGIGNIYANEILYYCKINPKTKGEKLKIYDMKNIVKFTKTILKNAIKKGGSTIKNFKNTKGIKGNYQKEFKVYNRENLNCSRSKCSGLIKKIIINNRSTFYCKKCQK
tara:strand:- start:352 stop:1215 length:864 start_codon:yes stop_codon:yes gene_type:complete